MRLLETSKKYPSLMLYSLILTLGAIYQTSYGFSESVLRFLAVAFLGYPFFAAIVYRAQLGKSSWKVKAAQMLMLLSCLALYYTFLPGNFTEIRRYFYEFVLVVFLAISCVVLIPLGRQREKFTWIYTLSLVLQALKTVLFSGVTYVCIVIFFWSLHTLFQVEIPYTWYPNAWYVCSVFLSQLFFFTFLPAHFEEFEQEEKGSEVKILEALAKYVLFPVAAIYAVTLYVYDVFIFTKGTLPSGLLGYSVGFFGLVVMVTFYFLHHLRSSFKIIDKGALLFSLLLLPEIGILFYALWLRIEQYGVTEVRYVLGAVGIFFLLLVVREIFFRGKKLFFVPVAAVLILIPSIWGPWSATHLSVQSQTQRLHSLLQKNQINTQEDIASNSTRLSSEDKTQVREIVQYLQNTHGKEIVYSYIPYVKPLFENVDIRTVLEVYPNNIQIKQYCSGVTKHEGIPITGFDTAIHMEVNEYDKMKQTGEVYDKQAMSYTVVSDGSENQLKVSIQSKDTNKILTLQLDDLIKATDLGLCTQQTMTFSFSKDTYVHAEQDNLSIRYYPERMNIVKEQDKWRVQDTSGILLLKGLL